MNNPEDRVILYTTERLIRHEEERDYYVEVPFDMPERTEELHVEIEIQPLGEGRAVIDLGLRGPSRMRGWSGGARTSFVVGPEKATPGYLPGDLTPGPWAVILGAYRVPEAGCEVRIRIRFRLEAYRWLKGDLHTHSVHSDGTYTLEEAGTIMEQLGCDFIATTDHNTVSQNFAHPKETDLVFIPGMELTTNRGHANFVGISDPVDDFRASGVEEVRLRIHEAKHKGTMVVLNHPHCDYCPWEWSYDVAYDCVEVWNGPWTQRNERALAWWQEQLAVGRQVVAVGGSDVHRPHPYVRHAMPTTWVYAASRTVEGILDGIRDGHVFLSYAPDGPAIDLTIGSCMMGDRCEAVVGDAVRLTLSHLRSGDTVKIISEQGIEHRFVAVNGSEYTHEWPAADRRFYRVEVWRYFQEADTMLLAALSNPIYLT